MRNKFPSRDFLSMPLRLGCIGKISRHDLKLEIYFALAQSFYFAMVRRLPQIEIDRLVVILHLPDAFRLKFYNSHMRKYNFLRGTRNKI